MLPLVLRRLVTGVFAIWFAALNVTRGTYMACLEHADAHQRTAAASAAPIASHTGHDMVAMAAVHAGHAGMTTTSHAATTPADDASRQSSQAPAHCTCVGDCCCVAPAQSMPHVRIAAAAITVVAITRFVATASDRPADIVRYRLPFATAPPANTIA